MCFLNTNPTKKPSALVWALTDSDLPAPLPSPDARVPVVSPKSCGSDNTVTSLSKAGRLGYWEPYYGTWDPLLQVLQCLFLNKLLLQQQIQRNHMGLKITACLCSWDKFWTKDTKRPKHPISTSKEPGEKPGCWKQKQGIVHAPCTQHLLRGARNT